MADIDRNSIIDAKKYISQLFSIHGKPNNIASFLSEKIRLTNRINPNNWNLNLELHGTFLRFNVGQEFCIQIGKREILVLCLKNDLPQDCQQEHSDFSFIGYSKGSGTIVTKNFKETPQFLAKVPNSIGMVFIQNIDNWLPRISASNTNFIKYAISNTKILPQSIGAHSVGAIEYLSDVVDATLPNPSFAYNSLRSISNENLAKLATSYNLYPRKAETTSSKFIRNPYIVEQAKRIANGKCQDCGNLAPFLTKGTNEPFLEIHHIVPLSLDGEDTIENVVALCPNCHRKRHYG